MFESIFQYYGFDWLGMIATFLSIWWIGDKHWYGFLAGAIASICWCFFGFYTESAPAFFANIIFFGVNIRGMIKWRRERS